MSCCEILFGAVHPTAPPSESHIPIYLDRASKKAYYYTGTGWELIWEIQAAGDGVPGVVSIDPNSPIYLDAEGALQVNCEKLKTQCGLATAAGVAAALGQLQEAFNSQLAQTSQALNTLTQRVTTLENVDYCAAISGCGGSGPGSGGVTQVSSASPEIVVDPDSGIGHVILHFLGSQVVGGGANGFVDVGNLRFQWGTFNTTTGYLNEVSMQYPFGSTPYTLIAMERNAGGWGAAAPQPTIYGTQNHPTDPANKFLVSVVRVLNNEQAALVGERTKYEAASGQWFGIGLKP